MLSKPSVKYYRLTEIYLSISLTLRQALRRIHSY